MHLSDMKTSIGKLVRFCTAFFVFTIVAGASCKRTVKSDQGEVKPISQQTALVVSFYNVENLFDIEDDPKTMDEDFTPTGKLQWDDVRYKSKLSHIPQVLDAIPGELPAFMGLCEIENKKVLDDLIMNPVFGGRYKIVHQDSPDERGIDVAALIDTTRLTLVSSNYTTVRLPDDADPNTRDLLYVKCESGGETLHFFVNHWPSRGGGQAETEKNRIAVANVLESLVAKILQRDQDAKILLMGDFNDYPTDPSIAKNLKAGIDADAMLFNYMYDDCLAKRGSHYYKGEWGTLDQFIGSWSLKNATKGWSAREDAANIFMNDLILFTDKEGNKRPNRTYIGDRYNEGGFSDHLPIYMILTLLP